MPGVTATTIAVGIDYTKNVDQANASIGASNVTTGDPRLVSQAVIDDINKHGGLAGRRVVPVWHAQDATSTQTAAEQEQAACADFTQDHHVFAIAAGGTDDFLSCATRSAVVVVGTVLAWYSDQDFARYPYFVDPGTLDLDSQAEAEVPLLVRQGYFGPWDTLNGTPGTAPVKVGILSIDLPSWNDEVDHHLVPLLSRNGIHVDPADLIRMYANKGTSDASQAVADINNATLRFRQDKITHVILPDDNGSVTQIFANDTYSQHYFPRLGVNSATGMEVLAGGGVVHPASFSGAEGLGFMPILDLPAGIGDAGVYASTQQRHCKAVAAAAGDSMTSTNAEATAFSYCDQLYTLQRVLNSMAVVSRENFLATLDATRRAYPAAEVPTTVLGPGHHDGITQGWDMRFDTNCSCAKYVGGAFTIQ